MHPPRARAVETLGEGDSTSGRMTGFRWNVALAAERPAWYTHSMDDVRGALAANLAELRKEENLTQAEFAQASPFYLDLESAAEISGTLLIALGTAFVLRVLRKYLEQA